MECSINFFMRFKYFIWISRASNHLSDFILKFLGLNSLSFRLSLLIFLFLDCFFLSFPFPLEPNPSLCVSHLHSSCPKLSFFFPFSLVRAFHWPNTGQTRFPLAQHHQVGPTYRVFLPRVGCGPTDRALCPC